MRAPQRKPREPIRQAEFDRRTAYANEVLNPKLWIASAEDLFATARLIEPELRLRWRSIAERSKRAQPITIHAVYILLIGFAVENLLKSRIVKFDRKAWRRKILESGKLPEEFKGNHDLLRLARRARLRLRREDEETMRRLTRFTRWAGRYPVPGDSAKLDPVEIFDDGKPGYVGHLMQSDLDHFPRFLVALASRFKISIDLSLGAPAND